MDSERVARVAEALQSSPFDALVCARPDNVLLLSGYWPVVGSSIAIFTRESAVALLVPADELDFARQGWADEIKTFESGSLDKLTGIGEIILDPLRKVCLSVGVKASGSIGTERCASFSPSTYASTLQWGAETGDILREVFRSASPQDATPLLERLKSTLTARESGILRQACAVAGDAFLAVAKELRAGMKEFEAAGSLQESLNRGMLDGARCDGFGYCMSGPNSALAYAAFQQSRERSFAPGDAILLHCNSYLGGMWTDITRTFSLSGPAHPEIREAVLEAGRAAFDAVSPRVEGRVVDAAARQVLDAHGFGKQFRHATGHAVGFSAINHNARPRIHPLSVDVLQPGMVFNIEPAVYIEGVCGLRHCNMVAVTNTGAELLTPFQQKREDLELA